MNSTARKSIFVLRNNDIGDLLVVTPLFEALLRWLPEAEILAGIGDWNRAVLENNPFIHAIVPANAPWHNKQICRVSQNSLRGRLAVLRYLAFSPEVRALRRWRPSIGIDILGSPQGSLLLRLAGIPFRIGTSGYHGRATGLHQHVPFDDECYVGRAALRFATLLGLPEEQLPAEKPQLFLSADERCEGERLWQHVAGHGARRMVVGFSGGYSEKCWPLGHFRRLLEIIDGVGGWSVLLVGGPQDATAGSGLEQGLRGVSSLAGQLTLRQSFGLTAASEAVVTNSSMLMHVAAAFDRKSVVVLGEAFASACQHAKLWSCNPLAVVLGREPGGRGIATPHEAAERIIGQ